MAELSDRTRRLARISMCNRAAADELTGEVETAMALTATEIGYVDAITPGTVAVSKAVIVAADGAIDALTFDSASTALTISAAATRGLYAGHVGTTACHFLDMIDAYTGMIIETGTYASAASKGVTLSASNPRPVTFVADDGGALLGAGNYRGVLSRVYVAETQTGQIALRAMRGQVKVATTKNLTIGTNEMNAINGVEGYIELAGTHTIGANTRVAAVHGYVEVTDDVTLTTGGKLVGLYAELGQVTGKTVSGIGTCGILVDRLDSDHSTHQAAWTTGLVIASSACTTAVNIGSCTDGIIFTGTVTEKCIDFGQVTLNGDSCCNLWSYGDGDGTIEVTITDYWFPIRMDVTSISNPAAGARLAALMYLKFNLTTEHHTNLDMQGIGLSMDLAKNFRYAHGLDIGQDISETLTASSGTHCAKFTLNLTSGKTLTSHASSCLFAQITGAGIYTPDTARLTILKLHRAAAVTAGGSYIHFDNLGTAEFGIDTPSSGSITHFFHWGNPNGGTGAKTGAICNTSGVGSEGAIKILVGGTTYYIPYFNAGNTSGSW